MIKISEIFYSIQGEGELLGVPSIFIRTSGCNLRCKWCDTPYASWTPEGDMMEISEILQQIQKFPCRYVVITGGEPMLFPEIHQLCQLLKEQQYHITIETAATIAPNDILCDLASLSPKLSNSTPEDISWHKKHEKIRHCPEIVRQWLDRGNFQIKFVVSQPQDLQEIETLLQQVASEIVPQKVFLMPEGTSLPEIHRHKEWLIAACIQKGYRYAHRLHIELFGNQKGT